MCVVYGGVIKNYSWMDCWTDKSKTKHKAKVKKRGRKNYSCGGGGDSEKASS